MYTLCCNRVGVMSVSEWPPYIFCWLCHNSKSYSHKPAGTAAALFIAKYTPVQCNVSSMYIREETVIYVIVLQIPQL